MREMFIGELAFLSNFYPSSIWYDGLLYPTVEHAYQAAKTMDPTQRWLIMGAMTPARAKELGRHTLLRPDWEQVKVGIMRTLLTIKFGEHEELLEKLLATGTLELVETNWWHDQIWGDCFCDVHRDIDGQNLLGKLLMELREVYD